MNNEIKEVIKILDDACNKITNLEISDDKKNEYIDLISNIQNILKNL